LISFVFNDVFVIMARVGCFLGLRLFWLAPYQRALCLFQDVPDQISATTNRGTEIPSYHVVVALPALKATHEISDETIKWNWTWMADAW
jgi:hypothetical protein